MTQSVCTACSASKQFSHRCSQSKHSHDHKHCLCRPDRRGTAWLPGRRSPRSARALRPRPASPGRLLRPHTLRPGRSPARAPRPGHTRRRSGHRRAARDRTGPLRTAGRVVVADGGLRAEHVRGDRAARRRVHSGDLDGGEDAGPLGGGRRILGIGQEATQRSGRRARDAIVEGDVARVALPVQVQADQAGVPLGEEGAAAYALGMRRVVERRCAVWLADRLDRCDLDAGSHQAAGRLRRGRAHGRHIVAAVQAETGLVE